MLILERNKKVWFCQISHGDVRQEKENLVRSASAGRSDTIEEETVEVDFRLYSLFVFFFLLFWTFQQVQYHRWIYVHILFPVEDMEAERTGVVRAYSLNSKQVSYVFRKKSQTCRCM